MSDLHNVPCPNAASVQSLKDQARDLFELLRNLTSRVEANTTFLFGPERNGGGWVKVHERQHEEGDVELKETMEVVRTGMTSMAVQVGDLSAKVKEICDKKSGWREVAKYTIPALLTSGAAVVAVLLK